MRLIDQVLGIRRRWFVLAAGLTALAIPAGALTAPSHAAKQLTERVTSVSKTMSGSDGFKVGFQVQQGAPTGYGGRYASLVIININQTSGHATQANQYTFKKKVKFTGSSSLSTGSFKATFANKKGTLKMSFHGKGKTFKIGTPKGCTGSGGTGRKGTLSGTLKLNAKETGGKFGTITIKSIPATMSTATYTCSPPLVKGVALSPPPTAKTLVIASKSTSGSVDEEISVTEKGTGYTFLHNYSITGEPSTDYSYSTDLKTRHHHRGKRNLRNRHVHGHAQVRQGLSGHPERHHVLSADGVDRHHHADGIEGPHGLSPAASEVGRPRCGRLSIGAGLSARSFAVRARPIAALDPSAASG